MGHNDEYHVQVIKFYISWISRFNFLSKVVIMPFKCRLCHTRNSNRSSNLDSCVKCLKTPSQDTYHFKYSGGYSQKLFCPYSSSNSPKPTKTQSDIEKEISKFETIFSFSSWQKIHDEKLIREKRKRSFRFAVRCPICWNICANVIELGDCGHIFCNGCISETFRQRPVGDPDFKCPVCRVGDRYLNHLWLIFIQSWKKRLCKILHHGFRPFAHEEKRFKTFFCQ